MTIFMLHMEPIEERYSFQWVTYFDKVFTQEGVAFQNVWGEQVKSQLSGKFFLDPVATNIWKLTQLANLLKMYSSIQEGDTVFFTDLWNPGLEVLPYVKALLKKDIHLVGYLHAGSYDYWDLTNQVGMTGWAKGLEESWFSVCDKIFVATNFHKDLVTSMRLVPKTNIKVVGFPLDIQGLTQTYGTNLKKDFGVFTGRKSVEKGYQKVLKLQKENKIIISLDRPRTKDQYYALLSEARYVIAPSYQETFGIGVVEGMACGCIPVVPDRLAFQEIVPSKWRYKESENIQDYINRAVTACQEDRVTVWACAKKYQYDTVIKQIIQELN